MRHSSMQRPLMTSTAGWGRASTPQQGIVMVMTLILLTVMAVSTAVAVRLSLTTDMVGANLRARTLAFQAAEAALREKAQREATVASTRTHAADDDSASIDDENIEHSQTIGLAAVLEILGGRVIEEKMTEGGY